MKIKDTTGHRGLAQWLGHFLVRLGSISRCFAKTWLLCFQFRSLLMHTLGAGGDGSSAWVPATHTLNSGLYSFSLAVVGIWLGKESKMNQSISLPFQ